MKTLINEFNNMNKMPLFEIEYGEEYFIYNIKATKKGLETKGETQTIEIEWDECFSLDEHLQGLYSLCVEELYIQ